MAATARRRDPGLEVPSGEVLTRAGVGTWWWDGATGTVRGPRSEDLLEGVTLAHRERVLAAIGDALRVGLDVAVEVERVGEDGGRRWIELRGRPGGPPRSPRVDGITIDLTERHLMESVRTEVLVGSHRARTEAERASARLALLAEVGTLLAATLVPEEIVARAAQLVADRLGDWCLVECRGHAGAADLRAAAHADPAEAARLGRAWSPDPTRSALWSPARVVEDGRAALVGLFDEVALAGASCAPIESDALVRLAPSTVIVAPLLGPGGPLGVLTVGRGTPPLGPDDLALVADLASRVGAALATIGLLASRTELARALQQTLLPPALPDIAGIDVAACFEVADPGIEIGGDFFDVFAVGDTWHLVVGDVCGRGASAAALTGLFRHTVRAVAASFAEGWSSPAEILGQSSAAIIEQIDDTRFVTAAMVSLGPERPEVRATVSCGGHPRPILVAPGRPPERIEVEGALLGVVEDPWLADVEVVLEPGSWLVLHTDGVTEARAGRELFGDDRLLAALDAARDAPTAHAVAQAVLDSVTAYRGASAAVDDVAVVVLGVPFSDW